MPTEVIMPQLGDSVSEGLVSKWLKQEGDAIHEFEPLLEITGDKIDTEIPAPCSGILLQILVPQGGTVLPGVKLGVIGEAGNEALRHTSDIAKAERTNPAASTGNEQVNDYNGYVSPVVARMVAEHQVDLNQIKGSGRDGRITKKDVETYLSGALHDETENDINGVPRQPPPHLPAPPLQQPAPARLRQAESVLSPDGEMVALNAMRKAIAEHMVFSKLHTSPHVTAVFEFDMSAVSTHRSAHKTEFAKHSVNLTISAYFALATVGALQNHRYLNAQWMDEGIWLHNRVNLGMAVALDEGLIVPVIKDAGDLNLMGMARAINDVAARARSKQLKPDEIKGGTFTITNHGVSGSLMATPIINQPQVAILGVGMVEKRVKVIDDMIAIRPCCYVTLTFDHRVADGAVGDAFMSDLKTRIENWQ